MELPEWFVNMDLGNLAVNDTIPSHIDTTTMSALGGFLSAPLSSFVYNPRTTASAPDDTNSVSLLRATSSANGQEWTAIETILIRFGDMPSGRFPVSFYDDEIRANVGCDAAVCLLKYEPWIIEAYNTSFAPPSLLRIVEKGNSLLPIGNIRGAPLGNNRNLNTTGKTIEYWSSENNVIYQMLRVNDGGYHYKPTPTVRRPRHALAYNVPSNLELLHRPFLSSEVLGPRGSVNSMQTGSPPSAGGSVRLTLCHTLQGPRPSSHNRTRMKR